MIKTIIFKGIIWNSHLIMFLCENGYHARFIRLFYLLRCMELAIIMLLGLSVYMLVSYVDQFVSNTGRSALSEGDSPLMVGQLFSQRT